MGLRYEDLDDQTRAFMLEEIEMDIGAGTIYVSRYLNDEGARAWHDLMREAARSGNDDSLAREVRRGRLLRSHYQRAKPKGGYTQAAVPVTAPETLGEGEFNRYYVRGLCRKAMANGANELEVYRAKAVQQPRPDSEAKIGMRVDPALILEDLRRTTGVEPALGLPPGPNSGLCLRLPKH